MMNRRIPLKRIGTGLVALYPFAVAANLTAAEFLPVLKVGSEVYSNVAVTGVTETDIYFKHARGLGNAKLKQLGADEQKHFRFDAVKSNEVEQRQVAATQRYHQEIAARKPAPPPPPEPEVEPPSTANLDDDPVVPDLHARSFRGQRPPQIVVDTWITSIPNIEGKFVLVEFWATWCGPCRKSIPHLNELQTKFKDRLVIIGLSDETEAAVRKMTSPEMNYAVGVDTQARTLRTVEVSGIPHAMLLDPQGIVRFEGMPQYLDESGLERLIAKYSK